MFSEVKYINKIFIIVHHINPKDLSFFTCCVFYTAYTFRSLEYIRFI